MSFECISQIVYRILNKEEILKHLMKRKWKEIVGNDAAKYSSPFLLKDSFLYIKVRNPYWRHTLSLLEEKIKENIEKEFSQIKIKKILFC